LDSLARGPTGPARGRKWAKRSKLTSDSLAVESDHSPATSFHEESVGESAEPRQDCVFADALWECPLKPIRCGM